MTRVLSRIAESSADDEIVQQLARAADLLVVCDFEGTLTNRDGDWRTPVDGSLPVVSGLAALPRTSVAIIAHDSVARLRLRGGDRLSDLVTLIERDGDEGFDGVGPSRQVPRKDLVLDALLVSNSPSVIFFAGDDDSDEPVFAALGIDDIGCKIGEGDTYATMRVRSPAELVAFLERVRLRRQEPIKPRRQSHSHAAS